MGRLTGAAVHVGVKPAASYKDLWGAPLVADCLVPEFSGAQDAQSSILVTLAIRTR